MGREAITVAQLNQYIKRSLEQDVLLMDVLVRGEISRLSFQRNGHVYFDLKDEHSSVNCAIWQDLPNKEELEVGSRVLVQGRISVYDVRGTYCLAVNAIQPEGEGALALAFARMKKKLEAEGLFDPAHKKPLPSFPKNVGVVTASTGAAIRDIQRIICDRNDYVDIYVFPVAVQGIHAPGDIASTIERIGRDHPEMDLLIVGRGGGSEEDLAAFNEEIVARSIYACPIPIISAVGHESDVSISDFVADVRAATPTDAANIAVPDMEGIRGRMEEARGALQRGLHQNVERWEARLEACRMPLLGQLLREQVEKRENRVEEAMKRMELLHPDRTLERGYAIVRGEDGSLLEGMAGLHPEERVEIQWKDGRAKALVTETKKES